MASACDCSAVVGTGAGAVARFDRRPGLGFLSAKAVQALLMSFFWFLVLVCGVDLLLLLLFFNFLIFFFFLGNRPIIKKKTDARGIPVNPKSKATLLYTRCSG